MFAADARKHTPGKNAEKENFSMRILVCDDDTAFAGQLAEKIEAIVKPQMPRSTVDCATDAAQLRALPLAKYDLAFLDIDMGPLNGVDLARRLHELRPDMLLIFVTNYVEYSHITDLRCVYRSATTDLRNMHTICLGKSKHIITVKKELCEKPLRIFCPKKFVGERKVLTLKPTTRYILTYVKSEL